MEITAHLVPAWIRSAALLALTALLLPACQRVGRQRALPSAHLAGALAVAVALAWAARVTPVPGLTVHLSGAALATWLLGADVALLAVSAGALVAVGFGAVDWTMAGLAALVNGALPVRLARAWLRLCERRFGTNLFVYLLGVAFLGTAAATLAAALAWTLLARLLGLAVPADAWVALVPLAYAEAFVTGGLTTILVVYRPQWVATFDDRRYLKR